MSCIVTASSSSVHVQFIASICQYWCSLFTVESHRRRSLLLGEVSTVLVSREMASRQQRRSSLAGSLLNRILLNFLAVYTAVGLT